LSRPEVLESSGLELAEGQAGLALGVVAGERREATQGAVALPPCAWRDKGLAIIVWSNC